MDLNSSSSTVELVISNRWQVFKVLGWKLSPVVFCHWLTLQSATWLSFQTSTNCNWSIKWGMVTGRWKWLNDTIEWLLSTKNSASVLPSPVVTGGPLNSSKMPPSPCDWASRASLLPFSVNSLKPSVEWWPMRNRRYSASWERPITFHSIRINSNSNLENSKLRM